MMNPKRLLAGLCCALALGACSSPNDANYPQALMEAACKHNALSVGAPVVADEVFVDHRFLELLLMRGNLVPGFDDIVALMLRERMQALETQNPDFHGQRALVNRAKAGQNLPPLPVLRLSVVPEPDARCTAYDYPQRYPRQAYPWLRRLGLPLGLCVAMENRADITPTVRIELDEREIGSQFSGFQWQHRLDVRLRDTARPGQPVLASMTEHLVRYGGGIAGTYYGYPCGEGQAHVQQVWQALQLRPDDRIRPPELVEYPAASALEVQDTTSEAQLAALQWVVPVGRTLAGALMTPDHNAWVDSRSTKDRSDDLFHVMQPGRLHTAVLPQVPGFGPTSTTGLAVTPRGYAVVGYRHPDPAKRVYYLIEVDQVGRAFALSRLSQAQYDKLARRD